MKRGRKWSEFNEARSVARFEPQIYPKSATRSKLTKFPEQEQLE